MLQRIFSAVFIGVVLCACQLSAAPATSEPVIIPSATAQTVTQAPTFTPEPSRTPPPTASSNGGNNNGGTTTCVPRSGWQSYVVASGDTLSSIARRSNTTVDELVKANCLANANQISAGQTLRVPALLPPVTNVPPTNTPTVGCANTWFFTFSTTVSGCPNAVVNMPAYAQDFEGGRVLWYGTRNLGSGSNTLYIMYNDGTWAQYPDTWEWDQPEYDPSILPPGGRLQPKWAIGKLWRTTNEVRQKLGWAYGAEAAFTGRYQDIVGLPPTTQPGYKFYVDYGISTDGKTKVIEFATAGQGVGGSRWQVVGSFAENTRPATACVNQWVYIFNTLPYGCPNPALVMEATGQDFEGGRVLWYPKAMHLQDGQLVQGTIFVIYNDGSWSSYGALFPLIPAQDFGTPPAGRFQPTNTIGNLWALYPDVRQKLGWAYEPEKTFKARYQDSVGMLPELLPGYIFYIDNGKGIVMQLEVRSAANGGSRWQVVGSS